MRFIISLATLAVLANPVWAGDCAIGGKLYEDGLKAGKAKDWPAAKTALRSSTLECNTFNNWYLLGQTQLELGETDDALSSFEDARRYAQQDNERALAIGRYAQILATKNAVSEPLTLLHEALRLHKNPPSWMSSLTRDLDNKRINQPLTVAEVTRALTNPATKSLDLQSKPNANVNINFKYNSVELMETSKGALDIIAAALTEPDLASTSFTIAGHADERGTEQYNVELSKKRAAHIIDQLVKRQPTLAKRLTVEGKGAREPLYPGHTEEDYMLNRRIELKVN